MDEAPVSNTGAGSAPDGTNGGGCLWSSWAFGEPSWLEAGQPHALRSTRRNRDCSAIARVAQLAEAARSDRECCGFESHCEHQTGMRRDGVSFNGRTSDFGSVHEGSNPSTPAVPV